MTESVGKFLLVCCLLWLDVRFQPMTLCFSCFFRWRENDPCEHFCPTKIYEDRAFLSLICSACSVECNGRVNNLGFGSHLRFLYTVVCVFLWLRVWALAWTFLRFFQSHRSYQLTFQEPENPPTSKFEYSSIASIRTYHAHPLHPSIQYSAQKFVAVRNCRLPVVVVRPDGCKQCSRTRCWKGWYTQSLSVRN